MQIEKTDNFQNIHQVTLQRYDMELVPDPRSPDQYSIKSQGLEKPLEVKPVKSVTKRPTSETDEEFSPYFKRQFMRDVSREKRNELC